MEIKVQEWAKGVVEAAQRNLGASRSINGKRRRTDASGDLRRGLSFKVVPSSSGVTIKFTSDQDYAAYINEGVSGTEKKYKTPFAFKYENPSKKHVNSILEWMKAKPIRLRERQGSGAIGGRRFTKSTDAGKRSAAYMIARSIKRKGIHPTYFMNDAIYDRLEELDDIVAEQIDKDIDESFN